MNNIKVESLDRKAFLHALEIAENQHKRWIMYIEALLQGVAIEEKMIVADHNKCEFGHWLYKHQYLFKQIGFLSSIETAHLQVHAIYSQIFAIFFPDNNHSSLLEITDKKLNRKERIVLNELHQNLQYYSHLMIEYLIQTKSYIIKLTDNEFYTEFQEMNTNLMEPSYV